MSDGQGNNIILSKQTDSQDYTIATKGDEYAFVYLPHGNKVEVSLEKIPGTKKIKLIWFDPRTGKKTEIGVKAVKASFEANLPSSGKNNDWILIMERN
ncbi:putative collagen-binding domain-containing protein [uncultured Proteiniphilum sp.]|uniref:putative collagen-binding domain-containing protein n=1 Tax=uncultured Proteiniphilum sp. TaxID=497637 RepID=UPI002612E1D4|nr:putative collagen-binding domain-containing protein [uncultured Proteiniphilum sp.]